MNILYNISIQIRTHTNTSQIPISAARQRDPSYYGNAEILTSPKERSYVERKAEKNQNINTTRESTYSYTTSFRAKFPITNSWLYFHFHLYYFLISVTSGPFKILLFAFTPNKLKNQRKGQSYKYLSYLFYRVHRELVFLLDFFPFRVQGNIDVEPKKLPSFDIASYRSTL